MANSYPQLALVTDAIAASMENTLVAAKLMRWKPVSSSKMSPTNKFQEIERVSPRFNVRRTTGGVANITAAKQDTVFGAEIFALNETITLDFTYEDFAHIRDEDMAARDDRLRAIGQNAGEDVDADLLKTVVECGNNATYTTVGNNVDDLEALLNGFVRMKDEGVADGAMFAVLSYQDLPVLSKYLVETTTANVQTQESILGTLGNSPKLKNLAGLQVLFTQQLPVITTGSAARGGTTQVDGAAQDVNYADVCQSTTTNGNYLTQTLVLKGAGAAGTIKDGEIFTIDGVNAWDNRKGASKGRLQQFRVIGDATADGLGAVTVRIFPAIVVASPGSFTGTAGVNNAHATCDAAPADSAAINFVGAASTDYLQRAIIARDAIRVASAELEDLPSGENASRKMMSVPLSLRAHRYSTGDTGTTNTRFDVAYQANVEAHGRWKSVRIWG